MYVYAAALEAAASSAAIVWLWVWWRESCIVNRRWIFLQQRQYTANLFRAYRCFEFGVLAPECEMHFIVRFITAVHPHALRC